MSKPHFGITTDPEELKKQEEVRQEESKQAEQDKQVEQVTNETVTTKSQSTTSSSRPKFGVSDVAAQVKSKDDHPVMRDTMNQSAHKTFGASTNVSDNDKIQNVHNVFALRPWWFWLRGYGISILGFILTIILSGTHSSFLLSFVNLLLYPFASAMLEEIGHNTNFPLPRLTYIVFGDRQQLDQGISHLIMPFIFGLRFIAFLIEFSFSFVIGTVGLVMMIKQIKE